MTDLRASQLDEIRQRAESALRHQHPSERPGNPANTARDVLALLSLVEALQREPRFLGRTNLLNLAEREGKVRRAAEAKVEALQEERDAARDNSSMWKKSYRSRLNDLETAESELVRLRSEVERLRVLLPEAIEWVERPVETANDAPLAVLFIEKCKALLEVNTVNASALVEQDTEEKTP